MSCAPSSGVQKARVREQVWRPHVTGRKLRSSGIDFAPMTWQKNVVGLAELIGDPESWYILVGYHWIVRWRFGFGAQNPVT